MIEILKIAPTVFFKKSKGRLYRLVRINISNNSNEEISKASVLVSGQSITNSFCIENLACGDSWQEIYIEDITKAQEVKFILSNRDKKQVCQKVITLVPAKKWSVHVVQLSHHDIGYTNLPSNVIDEHFEYLNNALDSIESTKHFPASAQMRIVVEAFWSIDNFLKKAPEKRIRKLLDLIKSGHIEITAFWGNMITEICGHETLIRSVYDSLKLKSKHKIPLISAQHNDITGISWGTCEVLSSAEIKILCAGIPLYYEWGYENMLPNGNPEKLFGRKGAGMFWWEAPSGKRILFWDNNIGCNGDFHTGLPTLERTLSILERENYPTNILRLPVRGAWRDNSPYTSGYAETIKAWNDQWEYPKLTCGTNTSFYNELGSNFDFDLPVHRGELPGQDYPMGCISRSDITAINRNNHNKISDAEKISSAAMILSSEIYPEEEISTAYENILLHDEHSFGYQFPAGPAMLASEAEKAVYAPRAGAMLHDVINKKLASIADNLKSDSNDIYKLIVFNTQSWPRTNIVHLPLRSLDNCGTTLVHVDPEQDEYKEGFLKSSLLKNRRHVVLPEGILNGKFELIDASTKKAVGFQVKDLLSHDDTLQYAAQRFGLGNGAKRCGVFEVPSGLRKELYFCAEEVPSFGYKAYEIVPCKNKRTLKPPAIKETKIENAYYLIKVDLRRNKITSIYDKDLKHELLDFESPWSFGDVIVNKPLPNGKNRTYKSSGGVPAQIINGTIFSSIERKLTCYGHPSIIQSIDIYKNIKKIDVSIRLLKDNTPLLDVNIAFPFKVTQPQFTYEGVLAQLRPVKDYFPGAYSDIIPVQNWVSVYNEDVSVIWSSIDAPVVKFSNLSYDYVSPAHSCVMHEGKFHAPAREQDFNTGWIFSNIFHNNFGTNFSVSQSGDYLFRYSFTSRKRSNNNYACFREGWENVSNLEPFLAYPNKNGMLDNEDSIVEIDNPGIILLTCKFINDKKGLFLRLWNVSDQGENVKLNIKCCLIANVIHTNIAEVPVQPQRHVQFGKSYCSFKMEPHSLINLKITLVPQITNNATIPGSIFDEHVFSKS